MSGKTAPSTKIVVLNHNTVVSSHNTVVSCHEMIVSCHDTIISCCDALTTYGSFYHENHVLLPEEAYLKLEAVVLRPRSNGSSAPKQWFFSLEHPQPFQGVHHQRQAFQYLRKLNDFIMKPYSRFQNTRVKSRNIGNISRRPTSINMPQMVLAAGVMIAHE